MFKKSFNKTITVTAGLFLLAGCTGEVDNPTNTIIPVDKIDSITGEWYLYESDIEGLSEAIDNGAGTLVITTDNTSASVGCNDFSGKLSVVDGVVEIDEAYFTEKACSGAWDMMEGESTLFKAILEVNRAEANSNTLILTSDTNELKFSKTKPKTNEDNNNKEGNTGEVYEFETADFKQSEITIQGDKGSSHYLQIKNDTGNNLIFTTHGSSSCPPTPKSATIEDNVFNLTIKEPNPEQMCTADFRPFYWEVTLPDSSTVVDAVVHDKKTYVFSEGYAITPLNNVESIKDIVNSKEVYADVTSNDGNRLINFVAVGPPNDETFIIRVEAGEGDVNIEVGHVAKYENSEVGNVYVGDDSLTYYGYSIILPLDSPEVTNFNVTITIFD